MQADVSIPEMRRTNYHTYQEKIHFPLAVYGCIDTASRKLLWLRVWVTNSNPKVVGRWYLEYLYESRVMPSILRLDKGTETGIITTMHAFLRQSHCDMDPCDTVIYASSTSNQVSLEIKMQIGQSSVCCTSVRVCMYTCISLIY